MAQLLTLMVQKETRLGSSASHNPSDFEYSTESIPQIFITIFKLIIIKNILLCASPQLESSYQFTYLPNNPRSFCLCALFILLFPCCRQAGLPHGRLTVLSQSRTISYSSNPIPPTSAQRRNDPSTQLPCYPTITTGLVACSTLVQSARHPTCRVDPRPPCSF